MKKSQIYEYDPKSHLDRQSWFEITGPDGQIFDPPGELKVRNGSIIFFRAHNDQAGSYGVVPGWVVSKPRKAPGRNMLIVRVIPLTPAERRRYRDRLRKIILTPKILFW